MSAIDLSVVIPVKDEEEIVAELFSRLKITLSALSLQWEVILVNDGSIDRTGKIIAELQQEEPRLRSIELCRNFGQTAALSAGIDHAAGSIIVTMDGDLQHDPAQIPVFLQKISEGFDIVIGWREGRNDALLKRRLPSLMANAVARTLIGVRFKDLGSTFKAGRASFFKQLDLFGDLHRFIPALAAANGARIAEIPIEIVPRSKGNSKYGLSRAPGVFQDIIFLLFYTRYITRPLRFFGLLAFVFFGSGFFIASALLSSVWLGIIRTVNDHQGMLLFSVLLMVAGLQFLTTGVLAELISRIYINTGRQKLYFIRNVN